MRRGASDDHIFDFGGIQLRRLSKNILDAVSRQIVGAGHVE
jgi:hypothetical protein